MILEQSSTADSIALKAAKALVCQWPHAKPPDADAWQIAIGAKLSCYPPMLVKECCDPRSGLATVREFPPTVQAVTEWCDARLQYYRNWANYVPIKPRFVQKPEVTPAEIEKQKPRVILLMADLAKRLRVTLLESRKSTKRGPTNDELRAHYSQAAE